MISASCISSRGGSIGCFCGPSPRSFKWFLRNSAWSHCKKLTGSLVVALCVHRLHLVLRIPDYLWFVVMIACGSAIYLAVFLILTAVSFWFEDRVGIVPPVFNMLNFGRYPLTIYNVFIQFLLSWIIPFGFATFYPTTYFLRRSAFTVYFHLVPVVAAGFAILAIVVWNRGVANYSSTGT